MSATEMQAPPPGEALDEGLKLRLPGRRNAAGAGWTWIARGWPLFTRAPLMWILSMVILFVLAVLVNLVPFLGGLVFQLLQAVFAGSLMYACRRLEQGGEFELEHLFSGFSKRFVPLLIVGALLLAGYIVIFLVFLAFAGMSILTAAMAGSADAFSAVMASSGTIAIGVLVAMGLMIPLLAAYWFAPVLVMLHDMPPTAAMKESFFACFRNFIPFVVYGLIMLVFAILAAIPFGLGFLVWAPLALTSTYIAYRTIFTEDGGAA